MSIADHQFVCTRPWEWFEIHRHGVVFLCCPAWLKRPVGNLLKESVAEIWNGPVACELRKSTANGSFHNCSSKRCPFLATRHPPVQKLPDIENSAIRTSMQRASGRVEFYPQRLNLCFDHSCNLACPSCRPHHLAMDQDEKRQVAKLTEIIKKALLPAAAEVTMSGFGDPFASPAYLDILKALDNQGESGSQLRLHSNGQLWTQERWGRFPNLHHRVAAAEISMDAATADTYQLNRPGGSFTTLLANLDFLANQPFKLTLSMVVQANNFAEIPQFLALAGSVNAKVYLSQLVNWGTFSKEEFLQRAVHLAGHPRHDILKNILAQIRHLPHVDIGNLNALFPCAP